MGMCLVHAYTILSTYAGPAALCSIFLTDPEYITNEILNANTLSYRTITLAYSVSTIASFLIILIFYHQHRTHIRSYIST